jgi:hypothetical protein
MAYWIDYGCVKNLTGEVSFYVSERSRRLIADVTDRLAVPRGFPDRVRVDHPCDTAIPAGYTTVRQSDPNLHTCD